MLLGHLRAQARELLQRRGELLRIFRAIDRLLDRCSTRRVGGRARSEHSLCFGSIHYKLPVLGPDGEDDALLTCCLGVKVLVEDQRLLRARGRSGERGCLVLQRSRSHCDAPLFEQPTGRQLAAFAPLSGASEQEESRYDCLLVQQRQPKAQAVATINVSTVASLSVQPPRALFGGRRVGGQQAGANRHTAPVPSCSTSTSLRVHTDHFPAVPVGRGGWSREEQTPDFSRTCNIRPRPKKREREREREGEGGKRTKGNSSRSSQKSTRRSPAKVPARGRCVAHVLCREIV